ncbi:TetR/AcrR family transcriptional regulator [Nocardia uniformis]|uniref:TetR/AcrR family transcriptional regulator n=1 Tax=Nocardia uniformis TaxID=53432 RepID=A0A849C6N3_9NOCA|nr:TetR/AcrR family transcriptional regulator [Nocardia uniformis]NNH70539.1 TetR/AcrR family transcriptional regulator [Nocardia uniformis]
MTPREDADLTAAARIRRTALRLFAENGFAATSLRQIAATAGVSHALVRHHFGSKDGLRRAVDEDVLDHFDHAIAGLDPHAGQQDLLIAFGDATAQLFGADTVRRDYIRRSLLETGPLGAHLFTRLLDGTRTHLARLREKPTEQDDRWAAYQILFLILGPMLLEPVMQQTLPVPVFDPDVIADRSRANQALLRHGLLSGHR